ncbi:MAG: hypothetical protein RLZZ546_1941 [Bacteroidota bacterium]
MLRTFCLFACLFTLTHLNAQIEFGLKAGLNSIDLVSDGIKINEQGERLKIDFNGSKYGHHVGLYSRIKFLGIYVEPAALFNSNSVDYRLTDYTEDGPIDQIFNEKYYSLDIPLMVGIKAGIIRMYGGPVGHLHISSTSDLTNFNSYSQKFKDATYGYQAGFGFDIWKLRLDVAYEGNLSAFGNHINIGDTDYSFGQSASRILGTIGYKF